jgi:hypothetical protein
MFDRFLFRLYAVGNIGTVSFGQLLLAHDKARFKYLLEAVMNIDMFIQSVQVYKT